MTQRINPAIFAIPIFVGISCSEKSTERVEESYELVKTDSFRVDNFTRVVIRDYSEQEDIYLGYAVSEDDILEISSEGEIIKRIHKKGDGPGNYGNWNPIGLAFGPNKERILELPFQVMTLNSDYETIHSYRIMSPLPIRANMPLGKTPYFQRNDTTMLLVGPSNYLSASYLIHNQEGKDTLQNFYELNLVSGSVRSVVPFEPNSVYKQSESIYKGVMGKSFFVDQKNQELAVVQELDPEILIYNLPDYSLKRTIPISYSEFITYNPVPMESAPDDPQAQNLGRLSARNQKLFNLGNGEYILQYFTGITESEFESRNSEDSPYFPSQDATEQRILIFKDGKQVGSEIPGIPGTIITILPDRKLLVQEPENTEIEEEFTRFTIYQVKLN
ncbi:hypothetical protein FHS59_003121 [Algoriphagus iocasae]|uniref:DUF4221 domain-containing protein n=1 Tax=Algoriphagus iocasae TaxID=1836499 RepID=A0A841MXZ1_9BACT|nr:hypothetical protein [Algoriphagus iocasae]MBB6327478.1 hypothetical protein [Algoriphagus iocasae]